MLPGTVNLANQMQNKRDLLKSITRGKPGEGGFPGATVTAVKPAANGQSKGKEAPRYLPIAPMPTKSSNITVGSYNHNNNNSNNINNNASALKPKLTQMNIVQKQLKSNSSTTTGTQPVIQLMAANPKGNVSLLAPKAIINPNVSSNGNNNNTIPNTQPQQQSQSLLIRPAAIPVQQQTGGAANNNYSKGGTTLVANKSAPAPVSSPAAQISLISNPLKSGAPVVLSKAAVDKICFKFGQAQAQVNAGALVLTKCKSSTNTKPAQDSSKVSPKPTTVVATPKPMPMLTPLSTPMPKLTPMPTPMPMPMPMTATANVVLPELKISALPAAITFNGAKLLKVQGGKLAVVMPPATVTAPSATINHSGASNKQRSKSLVGNVKNEVSDISEQINSPERRHSVAIMSKEVDVIEQPETIETITIEDDDSEEEEQQQQPSEQPQVQPKQQPTPSVQKSRKSSTASHSSITSSHSVGSSSGVSSSSLEMIILPAAQPEPPQQQQLPPPPPQQKKDEVPAEHTTQISILKAESVSKEEFEKSLQCSEKVEQTSPPFAPANRVPKANNQTSGTITLTPISRLQKEFVEPPAGVATISHLKRNMQNNFGMLRWREQQPGTLQNSTMRFQLNNFNLLQLSERCEPRKGPASYFERPLFDRPGRRPTDTTHPLLYLCSRCNCHGPASDFLAQRFCSICCVRRAHKRRQPNAPSNASESKISRLQEGKMSNGHLPQQQQQQQQHNKHLHQQLQQQQRERERERDQMRDRKPMAVSRPFRWTEYLKVKGAGAAAPIHLFLNPFPISPNCFERGMKLEAIDPENCSLFCVCTIVEVRGYRLKLNFDGYGSMYDFWVNADSMDIFPPGWCERTSHVLQPPKDHCTDRFNWYRYLVKTFSKAAPNALFTHLNRPAQTNLNGFKVGMHLEAEDLNDTGKICVATVADILDERIRVHFDGWDDCYDFWVHINSPYIHPCSWHEGRQQLIVPPDYQNIVFNWADYIAEVGGIAATADLFSPREPMEFQSRMKLEVVDQRNPCLIRPATVITRKGYRVQLHLDCWPSEYYFWLEDDSPDLHPIGWCEATSHELETPPGFQQLPAHMPCDVAGCRGFGNAKRFNLNMHALRDCCPYAPENWRQWRAKTVKPPRVLPDDIKLSNAPMPDKTAKESSPLLLSRLSNTNPNVEKAKSRVKAEKSRLSLDGEPKAKLKREEQKPLPVGVKKERKDQAHVPPRRETIKLTPLCMSIAKPIVADYGPQLKRNYHLWQMNSNFDLSLLKSNPLYWTNWDVYEFVERALNSSSIAQMLFDEEIDGRALLMMGRNDLSRYFNLKVGPAVKLFSLIVNLRIAVACKFKTTQLDLDMRPASSTLPNDPNGAQNIVRNFKFDNRLTSSTNSLKQDEEADGECNDNDFYEDEYPAREIIDEEDVMLDTDDFLSVKPIHSIAADPDVVMAALDELPPIRATIS